MIRPLIGSATLCSFVLSLLTLCSEVKAQPARIDSALEQQRVELIQDSVASGFGEEVRVRIIGELQALGVEVISIPHLEGSSTESAPPDATGRKSSSARSRIVLKERAGQLVVEVWCPSCDTPLLQMWNTDQYRSAETIAVRSVEALRASLLVYSQRQELTQGHEPARRDPSESSVAVSHKSTFTCRISLGPSLALQFDRRSVSPGLLGAMSLGLDHGELAWAAGLRAGGFQSAEYLVGAEGQAWVSRWFVDGFLELAPRLTESVELLAQSGAGLASYTTRSQPADGFAAARQSHQTLLVSARGGVRVALAQGWDLAVLVGVETTLDAPVIRFVGRPVATLDHPAGSAGISLSLVL